MPISFSKSGCLSLTLVFSVMSGSALADSISFQQADIYLSGLDAAAPMEILKSNWGSANYTYTGGSTSQYFNLSVDGVWRVKNMPLQAFGGMGDEATVTFNFDLGVPTGASVNTVNYGYTVTQSPVSAAPTISSVSTVSNRIISGGADIVGITPEMPAPSRILEGGSILSEASISKPPNQECGKNQCVPAAISNSLKYLNANYNLGMSDSDISIGSIATAVNTTPLGTALGFWNLKDAYLKSKGYKIKTVYTTSFKDVVNAVNQGLDVEIIGGAHFAMVVGAVDVGKGNYTLTVAHDTEQGKAGGTVIEPGTYSTTTNTISGITWMSGFTGAVIESPIPEPETYTLALIGLAVIAFTTRRSKNS